MSKYQCQECDMSLDTICCGKCQQPLVHDNITVDGNEVAVSRCPQCQGKIKSPQCCGKDMDACA